MTELEQTLQNLRAEIDKIESPEFRLLAHYIEAFHQKHSTRNIRRR